MNKKSISLGAGGAAVVIALVVGFLMHERWQQARQLEREEAASLLASCVNQGLLSLFRLQANDWRAQPTFYDAEAARYQKEIDGLLEERHGRFAQALPQPMVEATAVCRNLTAQSAENHHEIFAALANFLQQAPRPHQLQEDGTLQIYLQHWQVVRDVVEPARSYLSLLREQIGTELALSGLSAESRALATAAINSEVLDYYRRGRFSAQQAETFLIRQKAYYELLANNPEGYRVRGGTLLFTSAQLHRKVEGLANAVMQDSTAFEQSWHQLVSYQQAR